eukprot:9784279-Karenia_brevis.AAC.1
MMMTMAMTTIMIVMLLVVNLVEGYPHIMFGIMPGQFIQFWAHPTHSFTNTMATAPQNKTLR